MSAPPPSSAAQWQADALIEQIALQVEAQRRELLDAAARECEEIRERARVKARRQLRRAIAELRAAARQRMQQLRAELETAARRAASARALDALSAAWPQLGDALARRWRDTAARNRWLDAQLAQAQARLPSTGWLVRHPPDWSDGDCDALRAQLAARGVADARLHADQRVDTGLVVEVDGVRLDSTPQALLADRQFVEAALLAALEAGARHKHDGHDGHGEHGHE